MRHPSAGLALGVVVSVALLSGCAGSSRLVEGPAKAAGPVTLRGGIRFAGRIPPGYTANGYQRGRVQVLHHGKVLSSVYLEQGEGYEFVLPPGHYDIRTWGNGKPPYPPCPLTAVTIRRGRTTQANVTCQFH